MAMTSQVTECCVFVDLCSLPVGRYFGHWGGYNVRCNIRGKDYIFKTETGVRGMNIPVIIIVEEGGKVSVEAAKK